MEHKAIGQSAHYVVPLRFSSQQWHGVRAAPARAVRAREVRLRDMTGREERAVSSTNTPDALHLIDALFVDEELAADTPSQSVQHVVNSSSPRKRASARQTIANEKPQFSAADLSTSDRDRLLAAIYQRTFGDRIESTLTCAQCGSPFDLDFSLTALTRSMDAEPSVAYQVLEDGSIETSDGLRFRIPTGNDELAVAGLPPEEATSMLYERCGYPATAMETNHFEAVLDEIAPLIDLDLTASCPECGEAHTIEFDIQSFLLGAILGTQRQLLTSIHRLASAYRWSLDEILSLARNERMRFVELIEEDLPGDSGYGRSVSV